MSKQQNADVFIISLGCSKNLYDTEDMSGFLREAGIMPVGSPEEAQVILINTCGFIGDARNESEAVINEMLTDFPDKPLIVAGCMVQQYQKELRAQFPGIAALISFDNYQEIGRLARSLIEGSGGDTIGDGYRIPWWNSSRFRMTPGSYAYLKISEGCSRKCAFCTIPCIRGPYESQAPEDLLERARTLIDHGVQELILISQDSVRYGRDNNQGTLAGLMEQLLSIEELRWLRVLYLYPGPELDDDLLSLMAREERICSYLDIPLQHVAQPVLKRMQRSGNAGQFRDLMNRIKEQVPDAALRTTLITGFPGETDADFDEMASFVEDIRFDHLGCFTYSDEPKAAAYKLDGKVDTETAEKRHEQIMALQQEISLELNQARLESIQEVAVDLPGPEGVMQGHTAWQAPEVDGVVWIEGPAEPGTYISVQITECGEYDLIGKPV